MNPETLMQGFKENPHESASLICRARNAFWMAPLSGITDVCFRQLMDEMGAGVLISELVSAKGLIYNSGKTLRMIRIHPGPGTIAGVQLFGESADDIIEASLLVEEAGADFLDINLGCPVKKVVKKGCGAALLRDPAHLERFLYKIKTNISLPLTAKMRTGWDDNELTIHECVRAAANAGCEWVAIHGRTRSQGYNGQADWDLIRHVKQHAYVPIIGNGDIRDNQKARARLSESHVDAVMIGRGALRNPWIFRECTGELEPCHVPDRIALIRRYLALLEPCYDVRHVLIYVRKLIIWISSGHPGSSTLRRKLFTLNNTPAVLALAEEFFATVAHLPLPRFEGTEAFMMGGHG
ncbi:MAG: tRNA dihydrouridine synthase DusB [Nitrospinota bacterium]|nr:tRNA dihydrouridine synthase DusB [Nitrospinota bacterium]